MNINWNELLNSISFSPEVISLDNELSILNGKETVLLFFNLYKEKALTLKNTVPEHLFTKDYERIYDNYMFLSTQCACYYNMYLYTEEIESIRNDVYHNEYSSEELPKMEKIVYDRVNEIEKNKKILTDSLDYYYSKYNNKKITKAIK